MEGEGVCLFLFLVIELVEKQKLSLEVIYFVLGEDCFLVLLKFWFETALLDADDRVGDLLVREFLLGTGQQPRPILGIDHALSQQDEHGRWVVIAVLLIVE